MNLVDDNAILDVKGLAAVLNCTDKTARKLFLEGKLPGARKLGKKWFITGSAIKSYFSQETLVEGKK